MNVQRLIDKLMEVEDKTMEVIMSSDGEGNSYSPLDSTDQVLFDGMKSGNGEVAEIGDEPEYPDYKPAMALWPR